MHARNRHGPHGDRTRKLLRTPPRADLLRSRRAYAIALQKTFEHAQRCVEKGDHDYANQLFTQCVAEDPANVVFLQAFLGEPAQEVRQQQEGRQLRRAEDQEPSLGDGQGGPARASG